MVFNTLGLSILSPKKHRNIHLLPFHIDLYISLKSPQEIIIKKRASAISDNINITKQLTKKNNNKKDVLEKGAGKRNWRVRKA